MIFRLVIPFANWMANFKIGQIARLVGTNLWRAMCFLNGAQGASFNTSILLHDTAKIRLFELATQYSLSLSLSSVSSGIMTSEMIVQVPVDDCTNHIHEVVLRTQAQEHWREYAAQRNRVISFLRRVKSDFVEQAPTSNLHRLVTHLQISPKQTIRDLRTDTNIASSSIQKATILNEFFTRQSQQSVSLEPEDIPPITTTPNITSPLQSLTSSPQEVEKLLSSLDTHKSAGFDNIPTALLKEAAAELAPSLADLFYLSFATEEIPQDWKDGTITPFPIAGNPSLPTNYRPISLLSILSKVQERIIYCRLYNYITPIFHLTSQDSVAKTAQNFSSQDLSTTSQ